MSCPPKIRVATVASRNMRIQENQDGSIEFSGVQGRILNIILKFLKMEFKLVIAEDGEWGRNLSNGTWTGMIGKIQKDEADIAANEIIVTEVRKSIVDFSKAYITDEMVFATEKPEAVPTAMALVHSFDWTVWILTLIALLLMPFFIKCLCKTKSTYIDIFLKLLGSIVGQGEREKTKYPGSLKYRILMYFWWIFATVWSLSYSAVLFSILSIPSENFGVRNFKELSAAVEKGKYKCYIPRGSATLDAFLYSDKNYLQKLGETVVRNGWYSNNKPVTENRQIARKSALVASKKDCKMVAGPEDWKHHFLSEDSVMQYQAAIAMKKGYCHEERINTLVDRFNSAGLLLKILSDSYFLSWLSISDQRKIVIKDGKPLSINILKGGFGLLLLGLSLSFIVFIGEILYFRLEYSNK